MMILLPLGYTTPEPIYLGRWAPNGIYEDPTSGITPLFLRDNGVYRSNGTRQCSRSSLVDQHPTWVRTGDLP